MLDGSGTEVARVAYLEPGQVVTTDAGWTLKTVLGSCVAVTLFDAYACLGGMNHFLLPDGESEENPTRYGQGALRTLLARLEQLGSRTSDLTAGIFGGACMLDELSNVMHLGERNVELACAWLEQRRIPVVARDVLGRQARRLEFRVADGSTRVRLLGGGR